MSNKLIMAVVIPVWMIGVLYFFPPTRQYRIQWQRDRIYSNLSLPNEMKFIKKSKYGDLIDSSSKGWGWSYYYTYSGDRKLMIESFKQSLSNQGYEIWVEPSYWVVNGYDQKKNIHIRGSIHEPTSKIPIGVTVEGIH